MQVLLPCLGEEYFGSNAIQKDLIFSWNPLSKALITIRVSIKP